MNFDMPPEIGQMANFERAALYNTVTKYKPKHCFEIGTWRGGGSTYYIASALEAIQRGTLYTFELLPDVYSEAVRAYGSEWLHLNHRVHFYLGESMEICPKVLNIIGMCDFLMLDGECNSEFTKKEFDMFYPFMMQGAIVACHDWRNGKGDVLRPYFQDNPEEWKLLHETTEGVGLAIYRKVV